jgi:hypothetical protein
MEKLNRAIARNIVSRAIAVDTSFRQLDIDAPLALADLHLDLGAEKRIYKQIVHDIESVGYVPKFSATELFDAETVGEIINIVIKLTESGGPE